MSTIYTWPAATAEAFGFSHDEPVNWLVIAPLAFLTAVSAAIAIHQGLRPQGHTTVPLVILGICGVLSSGILLNSGVSGRTPTPDSPQAAQLWSLAEAEQLDDAVARWAHDNNIDLERTCALPEQTTVLCGVPAGGSASTYTLDFHAGENLEAVIDTPATAKR